MLHLRAMQTIISLHQWPNRFMYIPYDSFVYTDTYESTLMTMDHFFLRDIQYAIVEFEVNDNTNLNIHTERIAAQLSYRVPPTDLPAGVTDVKFVVTNYVTRFSPSKNKFIASNHKDILVFVQSSDVLTRAIFPTIPEQKLKIELFIEGAGYDPNIPFKTIVDFELAKNEKLMMNVNNVFTPQDEQIDIEVDQTPWTDVELSF